MKRLVWEMLQLVMEVFLLFFNGIGLRFYLIVRAKLPQLLGFLRFKRLAGG